MRNLIKKLIGFNQKTNMSTLYVTSDTEESFGCEAEAPETFFDRKPMSMFTAAMQLTL